jgi:acetate kinase
MVCFDTSFHRTQPWVAEAFALPRRYTAEGVRRYGFHGLSYEYIPQFCSRWIKTVNLNAQCGAPWQRRQHVSSP